MGSIYSMPKISRQWLPSPLSESEFKFLERQGVQFLERDKTGRMIKVELDRSLYVDIHDDVLDGTMTGTLKKNGTTIAIMDWGDAFGHPSWAKIVCLFNV